MYSSCPLLLLVLAASSISTTPLPQTSPADSFKHLILSRLAPSSFQIMDSSPIIIPDKEVETFIRFDKTTDVAAFSFDTPEISPTVKICGLSDPLFQFDVIRLDPEPPVKGPLNVHVEGTLHQTINGGDIHLVVKLGYIKLITLKLDLCEYTAKIDFPCPIPAGKKVFDRTFDIPEELPRGKYVIDALVIADTSEQIACVTATVRFP